MSAAINANRSTAPGPMLMGLTPDELRRCDEHLARGLGWYLHPDLGRYRGIRPRTWPRLAEPIPHYTTDPEEYDYIRRRLWAEGFEVRVREQLSGVECRITRVNPESLLAEWTYVGRADTRELAQAEAVRQALGLPPFPVELPWA